MALGLPSAPPALPSPNGGRGRGGLLLVALLLVLGGCRVDATLKAQVDGQSGLVLARIALDREAMAVLGGKLDQGAQVEDLRPAGWTVRVRDGVVEVSKRFTRPQDFAAVIREFSGPSGPLRGFRLDRQRSLGRVRYRLSGTVDLGAGGVGATGLANAVGLATRLRDAGIDPVRVEALLEARVREGFHLTVVLDLPGEEQAAAPEHVDGRPAWPAALDRPVAVEATSSVPDRLRPALAALALVLAVAAVVLVLTGRRSRNRGS